MNKINVHIDNALDKILSEIDPKIEKRVEFRMRIAEKIDKARITKGLSKKQLAEKLSKRPSEISKWLSGTHNFTSDTLFEIQNLLDIVLVDVEEKTKEHVLYFNAEVVQTGVGKAVYYPANTNMEDFIKMYYQHFLYSSINPSYFNKTEARA